VHESCSPDLGDRRVHQNLPSFLSQDASQSPRRPKPGRRWITVIRRLVMTQCALSPRILLRSEKGGAGPDVRAVGDASMEYRTSFRRRDVLISWATFRVAFWWKSPGKPSIQVHPHPSGMGFHLAQYQIHQRKKSR